MGYTKSSDVIQCAVCNALGVGRQSAISRAELNRIAGYKDRRIREAIKAIWCSKVAINLDNGGGYYIPSSALQSHRGAATWTTRQDRRIRSMKTTTKGARRFVNGVRSKDIPGQIGMFEMGGIQIGKTQREKRKRNERELANLPKDHGYNCRRGQQYCGTNGGTDVVGLPGIHIEYKRVEHLSLEDAMRQAIDDVEAEKLPFSEEIHPTVFRRRNRGSWLVTMRLDDWTDLYREWDAGRQLDGD